MTKVKTEGHGSAWNRVYHIRKTYGWGKAGRCPIRLRGYSELVMERIRPKLRKKIDTALKRGYRLDGKDDLVKILDMICSYNPIQAIVIGYVGKTRMSIYLPTRDDADDLKRELEAQVVMTEAFKGAELRVLHSDNPTGYEHEVFLKQWHNAGGKGSRDQPQLKAVTRECRFAIDEWMDKEAAVRERIAHWCAQDDSVIRIPFDTHPEE